VASLTIITYDCNSFIIQATGGHYSPTLDLADRYSSSIRRRVSIEEEKVSVGQPDRDNPGYPARAAGALPPPAQLCGRCGSSRKSV